MPDGIVVRSGPGGFTKVTVTFEEAERHAALTTDAAVAVGEIVAVGDGTGVGDGAGVSGGDVTAIAGVLAPHDSVIKPSPTRRLADHRGDLIMRASMFSPSFTSTHPHDYTLAAQRCPRHAGRNL